MIDDISKAMARFDENMEEEVPGTYADYQSATFEQCKLVTNQAQDMVIKSSSSPGELAQTARKVTDAYCAMVDSARKARATMDSSQVATMLKTAVEGLGETCKDLVHAGASVQGNPKDALSKKDLSDSAREVTQKVKRLKHVTCPSHAMHMPNDLCLLQAYHVVPHAWYMLLRSSHSYHMLPPHVTCPGIPA